MVGFSILSQYWYSVFFKVSISINNWKHCDMSPVSVLPFQAYKSSDL